MGIISDIFGANKAAKAQEKAADKAAQASQYATDQSMALQRQMFDTIWGATQQQRNLGNTATGKLQGLLDGTTNAMDFVRATPGYQVGLDAGQRQLNASAAAKGGLLSGAAAREGLRFGQDYATSVLNNERNALMGMAGLGQTATNTGANVGTNTTNAQQNALMTNAANLGSSYQKKADAQSGFWGSVTSALNPFGSSSQGGSQGGNALTTALKFFGM